MRIILLGAPGTGKGTQAQFLMKQYGIPHISTGEMLRAVAKTSSNFGKTVKAIINNGTLVTDDLVITLVKKRLFEKDCKNGFQLDGFPRTIVQADAIKEANINIDYVLEFFAPDKCIVDRIMGRRVHEISGRIYHVKYNPPKIEGKDDLTGENLITRRDDQEDIIRKRLLEYHQLTASLIDYYNKKAKEGLIKYFKIDATAQVADVSKQLIKILSNR
ncbi:adenylate kinase [Candidatus Pantoea carbekii]|uniref:Adenylate kinase n=1 Tax=Candidatus Pantoea carbekii TaxID=1235990 RepID=U3U8E2_9GAMM|nr:adenylate kinase [Candidatus Pantoea carbekii]AKC32218.1 adenylate kinase Adk [Candidatus Pantoea carbekii]BAO00752.1 adenylate kinase [Candidatus Pantoea carbekii]